jgi:hypothetical protein
MFALAEGPCGWSKNRGTAVLSGDYAELVSLVKSRTQRARFRKVFGRGKSYVMCYGALILHPAIRRSLAKQAGDFPLTRRSNQTFSFSAESAASACEIRAASYVSSALGRDGGISTTSATDDDLVAQLAIDFVSFGAMNNG